LFIFSLGILIDELPEKIGFAGDYITLQLIGVDIQKVYVGQYYVTLQSIGLDMYTESVSSSTKPYLH